MTPYYEDSAVTIYHGDCRDVMPSLESESCDVVFTDPPYVVSYSGRWGSDWGIIEGDRNSDWILPVYTECWRVLKPDALCITFYGWAQALKFLTAWDVIGFRAVSLLVFIKSRFGLGYFTRGQHEQAYILVKGNPKKPDRAISDVLQWATPQCQQHPNQKPIGATSKVLSTYANTESTIIDPFMGSGTTLRAAKDLGMRAIGIEIEERYCEIAAKRMAQEVFAYA
jgi:adenine-specific DNA-methyltransferase